MTYEPQAKCIVCHLEAALSTMTPVGTRGSYRCADATECVARYRKGVRQ